MLLYARRDGTTAPFARIAFGVPLSQATDAALAFNLLATTTGKNFRTTAVDLAAAHRVAVESALGSSDGTGGPTLTSAMLDDWVAELLDRLGAMCSRGPVRRCLVVPAGVACGFAAPVPGGTSEDGATMLKAHPQLCCPRPQDRPHLPARRR